jgi:type 2 lantibiotic biosynthesis protein LanM
LGESQEAIKERCPAMPWLAELEKAFSRREAPKIKIIPPSELQPGQESNGFLYAIEPLVSQGIEKLEKGIEALANQQQEDSPLPFDPNTAKAILFKNLPEQLLAMLSQTMALELNVARLQGLLSGATARERFLSFLERIYQRDIMLAILQEYPVLARQLILQIDRWVSFSLEFLQHLLADWAAICSTFTHQNYPGVLVEIKGNAGDTHQGGRSVVIAKFSSGFQVVYKPKSLAADVHLQELFVWLNERSSHPPFRTIKVLECGTYGWVEFVNFESCRSQQEVWRFYQRMGGYLALLYALEATDFHSENLIAAGEQPVLIDLETLFHPRRRVTDEGESVFLAREEMTYSVLRAGLLPHRLWANEESAGVDLSGIGATPGQVMPKPIRSWEGVATDSMRVVREQTSLAGSQNRPRLNDSEINVLEYSEAIIEGFTSVYRCLAKYRDDLSQFLKRFAGDEVRVVLRQTRTYSLLIGESFHPDLLRNALERDRLFDRLWVDAQYRPDLAKVIPKERKDLWQGDIPMFAARANSRDLVASNNCYPDFFERSGMELVQHRLQQLDEGDLKRQIWFIRASLSTLALAAKPAGWKSYSPLAPQTVPDDALRRSLCLEKAKAVGDRLELLALRGDSDATWIGVTLVGGKHWTLQPLNWSLYDGISGVAFFLAYLGAVTEEKRYTHLARAALKTLQHQVRQNESLIKSIGGFSGWGGIIYTLSHLGVLWQQPELLEEAAGFVGVVRAKISQDERLDVIDGAAGCIGSLLALYSVFPSDDILAAAIECGDRLIEKLQSQELVSWVSQAEITRTGFAHGIPGIARALLELAGHCWNRQDACSTEERFLETALAALDLPKLASQKQDGELATWCNGAPGVGLALLSFLHSSYLQARCPDNTDIRAAIEGAIATTLTRGFGLNHCLCHGDLGNIEFLLRARQILGDSQRSDRIDGIAATILESIDKYGFLCGVPLGVETPGLMTGIAGIGYGLLRLAEGDRVPSVLVQAPPGS